MKKFLKILGYTFAALLSLVAIVVGFSYLRTATKMDRIYDVQPAGITIPTDSASVSWGKHIAETHGCMSCHGQNLAGRVELDDWALGRIVPVNLTGGRGGVQKQRTTRGWVRAIRHGSRFCQCAAYRTNARRQVIEG